RGPAQLAALVAAVLIAVQLTSSYWFYFYVVWFAPFVLIALFSLDIPRSTQIPSGIRVWSTHSSSRISSASRRSRRRRATIARRGRALRAGHGGEEIKRRGAALMLRCGRAADAARLGLRTVSGLEAFPGFPVARVGVHPGSAVCRENDWYGNPVNVASRLCTA